jgi:hypothetical protein
MFTRNGSLRDHVWLFPGYLMLDALIGNTDRHHENWGARVLAGLGNGRRMAVLAPTYDHASSEGCRSQFAACFWKTVPLTLPA